VSSGKKIEIRGEESDDPPAAEPGAEGWESLAEEASAGSLTPSRELEEALREAAEGFDESGRRAPRPGEGDSRQAEAAPAAPELARELEQTQARLLRLQADFENFRRRAQREKTEAHQYGHQNLVKDLLSAVDNLDRAIDHARGSGGGDLESLLQGVELVRRELSTAFAKHGVTQLEAVGRPFDPALHEAMAQIPDASAAPNTVVEELQKGYVIRDRLLRPARVVVTRAPGSEAAEESTGAGEAASEEEGSTD
jgi:molecular chaperone GrpE